MILRLCRRRTRICSLCNLLKTRDTNASHLLAVDLQNAIAFRGRDNYWREEGRDLIVQTLKSSAWPRVGWTNMLHSPCSISTPLSQCFEGWTMWYLETHSSCKF